MITKTYALLLFDAPKSVNAGGGGARSNPYVGAKEKKRWEGQFLMELLATKVRKHMDFCAVEVTIRWKRRNHRDVENYRHPVVKPLLDALVKGDYIQDDTEEWVEVRDFRFEYPEEWPHRDPRRVAEMVIKIEGTWADGTT